MVFFDISRLFSIILVVLFEKNYIIFRIIFFKVEIEIKMLF